MSTPRKNGPEHPVEEASKASGVGFGSRVLRLLDGVYHFLASLKLAVISLGLLAMVLGYATFFEKWYGTAAVQEWIYRGKPFAVLLAFLGANIFCAASIRFPWKKRQTGFVVTHAGLLIVLAGSWWSLLTADNGVVGAMEGETKSELVRTDYPVVRIREYDATHPAEPLREWELPFRPGSFAWGPGKPKSETVFADLNPATWFDRSDPNHPVDVLTKPNDPFQFVVKSHIPASTMMTVHESGPTGTPMIEIRPTFKAPGMPEPSDVFPFAEQRWFKSDTRLNRVVRSRGPALFAFQYVEKEELIEEFLNPPADAGSEGVAQFRYDDKNGKRRRFDLKLDDQKGKPVVLPDSDIEVTLLEILPFNARQAGLDEVLGSPVIPLVEFNIKKGDGPTVKHLGLASLPTFPNVFPSANPVPGAAPPKSIADFTFYLPPTFDANGMSSRGLVEVLGTPDGKVYYRVFGRPEGIKGKMLGVVRQKGEVTIGKPVVAFGGQGNGSMPMSIAFTVEHYFPKGVEREVAESLTLPTNLLEQAIPASEVEMTVKGEGSEKPVSKTFFMRRSIRPLEQTWQTVRIGDHLYEIAYDADRRPLGFDVKLDDFDVGFDPGTEQASRFVSQVRLTDKDAKIVDRPFTISMNEPMTHKGYTFYQSKYDKIVDERTNQPTGDFQSIFQVGIDPGRRVKYFGCLLVVLGSFLQFYMRAGLFTDGGKREREKAEKKAAGSHSSVGSNGSHSANGHSASNQQALPTVQEEEYESL